MAQQLTRAGEQVAFLGLIDTYASRYPRMRWNAPLRFRIFRRFGIPLPQSPDRGAAGLAWEMINLWVSRTSIWLRQLGGRAVTRDAGYLSFLDAALRARRRYRISPYPGKITLFRYTEQPSPALYQPDPLLGWRGAAPGGFDVVDVPGAHAKVSPQDFQEMCNQMRERIRAAQGALGCVEAAAAS
jgi:thioesterase domain-containing protein